MNYRKLSGRYDLLLGGITFPFLRRILVNPTRVTTPGRVKCLSDQHVYQWQCHRMIGCVKSPNPPVLLQDPDRVLCSALDGEARIDFRLMNAGSLETLPTQNRHSRGDNLPEVRADPEEGVVVLTLVSLAPEDSKTKNDNYLFNPTAVVKKPISWARIRQ